MEDAPAVRKKRRIGQGGHSQERPGVAVSVSWRENQRVALLRRFVDELTGWVASLEKAAREMFRAMEKRIRRALLTGRGACPALEIDDSPAIGIGCTAPELSARVLACLGRTQDHRLSTLGTRRDVICRIRLI